MPRSAPKGQIYLHQNRGREAFNNNIKTKIPAIKGAVGKTREAGSEKIKPELISIAGETKTAKDLVNKAIGSNSPTCKIPRAAQTNKINKSAYL